MCSSNISWPKGSSDLVSICPYCRPAHKSLVVPQTMSHGLYVEDLFALSLTCGSGAPRRMSQLQTIFERLQCMSMSVQDRDRSEMPTKPRWS